MSTRNIVPRADGEGNIGTSSKSWLSGFFTTLNILGETILSQITKPAAPAAGKNKIYFKSDNNLYKQNSAGVEAQVGGNGDMTKAVYDTDDNGIADKAETLNDDSSGGGNEVTALEARTHIDDTENPHAVDKTDVALGNVPNIDTTDAVANEHVQGTDTGLDSGGANPITAATIKNHVEDVANPHSVEADQIATDESGETVQNHIDDISNPHSVTKAQVGLTNVDDVQQMPLSYLDTDPNLAADSDAKVASQKAVKDYIDALLGANDAMTYKGVIDCGGNPNYPAADTGDTYRISVAGKLGGASGEVVEVGDMAICLADSTASGDQASVGAFWNIIQVNIDGNIVGTSPYSSVDDNLVMFNGTSGKVIEDSGLALTDVTGHIADMNNPHNVEADQIGTTTSGSTVQDLLDNIPIPTEGINVYFVGKHGNDSNDGKDWNNVKLTIQNAIDAASSGDVVVVVDAGIYAEDIDCKDGVELYAPNATLNLASSDQLILADQKTTFYKITKSGDASYGIGNIGSGITSILVADEVIDSSFDYTIRNLAIAGTLILHIKKLTISGVGISDSGGSTSIINLNIDEIYLNNDNAKAIELVTAINITGYVHRILELGSRSGTMAFDINAGTINLNVNVIIADTAYDVESGATLNLFCNSLQGTELNDGTANICVADTVADAITHKDLSNNPHSVVADQIGTDDSGVDVQAALDAVESDVSDLKESVLTFVIDGGGSEISTGVKGDLLVPFGCTITKVTLLADQTGSVVIDIWKDTYANFDPTNADSITASAPPTISTAAKSQDATLTGWTTTITAEDILRFNVDSITDIQRVSIILSITRT